MLSEKTRLFIVGSFFLILIMMAALVWSVVTREEPVYESIPTAYDAEEVEQPVFEAAPKNVVAKNLGSAERSILENHFKAIGGADRLATIKSIRMSGTIDYASGESLPIVIIKKLGQRTRVSLTRPEGQFIASATPEEGWRGGYVNGQLRFFEEVSAIDHQNMLRTAYPVSELYLATHNAWTIQYLGQMAFNQRMAHCFEVSGLASRPTRFYIDPETFLDLGREDYLLSEDGDFKVSRNLSLEHMDVSGLVLTSKVGVYQGDEYIQTFTAETIEVNPGILDSYFEKPDLPED